LAPGLSISGLRLSQAYNKFGWSIPSIPSPIVMTPSSGSSKAEFYDALQRLQAKEDINLVRTIGTFFHRCPEVSVNE
jgi:hypothetical protein